MENIIDSKMELDGLSPPVSETKLRKKHNHRRVRRLGETRREEPKLSTNVEKRHFYIIIVIIFSLSILVGQYLQDRNIDYFYNMRRNFAQTFRKHYHQIVYGRLDYCSPSWNVTKLTDDIKDKHKIVNQQTAHHLLRAALRNGSQLNAIAMVGPYGVGKSMWARTLAENFPWPENVHSYLWNTYVEDDSEKFHMLRLFTGRLSDCGRNLLIIDNLVPCDRDIVNTFNEMIATAVEMSGAAKHVIVIYIFNLKSTDDFSVSTRVQFETPPELPGIKVVSFRAFHKEDLLDCIRVELDMLKLHLTQEAFNEIVDTIDVEHSGCKNVRAKVLAYGTKALF